MKLLADIKRDLGTAVDPHHPRPGRRVAGSSDRTLVGCTAATIMEEGTTDAIFATPTHPYTLGPPVRRPPQFDREDEELLTIAGDAARPAQPAARLPASFPAAPLPGPENATAPAASARQPLPDGRRSRLPRRPGQRNRLPATRPPNDRGPPPKAPSSRSMTSA